MLAENGDESRKTLPPSFLVLVRHRSLRKRKHKTKMVSLFVSPARKGRYLILAPNEMMRIQIK